jgi:hypothetical protein
MMRDADFFDAKTAMMDFVPTDSAFMMVPTEPMMMKPQMRRHRHTISHAYPPLMTAGDHELAMLQSHGFQASMQPPQRLRAMTELPYGFNDSPMNDDVRFIVMMSYLR